MAPRSGWFRSRVNSGRLAEPATYAVGGPFPSDIGPELGSVAPDAALPGGGRLRDRLGRGFVAVVARAEGPSGSVERVEVGRGSPYGDEVAWVVRPDGHLARAAPLANADPETLDALVEAALR
jgi:hypothetical protein